MTQEEQAFEKWQSEPLRIGTYHSNLEAWQASRESLKQELLSDGMVEVIKREINYWMDSDNDEELTYAAEDALQAVVGKL